MRSGEIVQRFEEIVGKGNAGGYISSVLVAVSQSTDLQACDTNSIIGSAMRAATMKLSVDPSVAHAYMVPFKDHGVPKATFIVGYKGLHHMAIRSGKYRRLNLVAVYANDKIIEDRLTGDIEFVEKCESALELHNRHIGKDLPVGYLLYIELTNGYKKTFFMTCEECDAHGRKFSKNYFKYGSQEPNPASMWHKDPHAMYKKTVIRMGILKHGYLDPQDLSNMNSFDESEENEDYLKGVRIEELPRDSVSQNIAALGYGGESSNAVDLEYEQPLDENANDGADQEPQTGGMTFEEACLVKSSDNSLYIAMTDKDLKGHLMGLDKKLKGNLNQDEQSACLRKVDAIKIILDTREKNAAESVQQPLPIG